MAKNSKKESFLLISNKKEEKVFEINSNGDVGYTIKGKYRIADNDKKLGVALGRALITLMKINEELVKKI